MRLTARSWDGLYRTFPTEPESVASLSRVIWWALHFCILAKWVMAGCRLWTTAASVYCALQIGKSCREQAMEGSKEGCKKDGEKLLKRSALLYGETSGFSQKCTVQPSCFWFLMHSAVQKQPWLQFRAITEHAGRQRERTWGKKAKKMRETTSQS